jgi:glyoxylase-like metal-dependent hydrolase (beta-lactamase superfamily II)
MVSHFHLDHAGLVRDFQGLTNSGSRAFLESVGIRAEVIPTSGHSYDSVSLVTDSGEALIGDLYPVSQIMDNDVESNQSWARIRALDAKHVFPSHAEPFELK